MTLQVDRRAQLGGAPGLHALVIGVGEYPNLPGAAGVTDNVFDMGPVTCTVPAALAVANWLTQHADDLPVPLATLRILLSPGPPGNPAVSRATLTNVQQETNAWRRDASAHRDGFSFFYFAGHGVARGRDDAVLLLEDFNVPARPLLSEAVDLQSFFYGMAPAPERPDIARNQLYLVDACRTTPAVFATFQNLRCSAALDIPRAALDDRKAPILYGSLEQGQASGLPHQPTAFATALLECLGGDAAEEVPDDYGNASWRVTNYSLSKALREKLEAFNQEHGGGQDFVPGGIDKELALLTLANPPQVPIVVAIEPGVACQSGRIDIAGVLGNPVDSCLPPIQPHPYQRTVTAGIYVVRCSFEPPVPPYHDREQPFRARPPTSTCRLRVT